MRLSARHVCVCVCCSDVEQAHRANCAHDLFAPRLWMVRDGCHVPDRACGILPGICHTRRVRAKPRAVVVPNHCAAVCARQNRAGMLYTHTHTQSPRPLGKSDLWLSRNGSVAAHLLCLRHNRDTHTHNGSPLMQMRMQMYIKALLVRLLLLMMMMRRARARIVFARARVLMLVFTPLVPPNKRACASVRPVRACNATENRPPPDNGPVGVRPINHVRRVAARPGLRRRRCAHAKPISFARC